MRKITVTIGLRSSGRPLSKSRLLIKPAQCASFIFAHYDLIHQATSGEAEDGEILWNVSLRISKRI
jgi:hypothetical protein